MSSEFGKRTISAEAIDSLYRAAAVVGLIAAAAGQTKSAYSTGLVENIHHAADLVNDLIDVAINEITEGDQHDSY